MWRSGLAFGTNFAARCSGRRAAKPVLKDLGLRGSGEALEASVCEILRLTEPQEGESVLVETSFDLAAEALSGDSRRLLEEKGAQLREWMRAMGLATPGGVHDDGLMIVPTWVQGVLKAAGA